MKQAKTDFDEWYESVWKSYPWYIRWWEILKVEVWLWFYMRRKGTK